VNDVVMQLLTLDDVAGVLRKSPSSVRRLVADGVLPAVHVGRSVRVRPVDLEEFIGKLPVSRGAA